jgi:hypothetical protein
VVQIEEEREQMMDPIIDLIKELLRLLINAIIVMEKAIGK